MPEPLEPIPPRLVKCEWCNGLGDYYWPSEDGGSPLLECPKCKGKRKVLVRENNNLL